MLCAPATKLDESNTDWIDGGSTYWDVESNGARRVERNTGWDDERNTGKS